MKIGISQVAYVGSGLTRRSQELRADRDRTALSSWCQASSYMSITETMSEPLCATYTFEAVATSPDGFWPTGGSVVTSTLVLVSITDTVFPLEPGGPPRTLLT
jgi:hypothetical protein